MKRTTKSAEILRLYALGTLSTTQIAEKVGCLPEYVRVVARQRRGRGQSEHDLTYLNKTGREMRRRMPSRVARRAA